AASSGTLKTWTAPYQQQLRARPSDRTAMFAVAAMYRLSYQYQRADSMYVAIERANANDAFGHQSQLWRVLIRISNGKYAQAGAQLQSIEQRALRTGDTLTALDAILARSAIAVRASGAHAGLAILTRGDSLNWKRSPELNASSRCRLSGIHSRLGNREQARALAREGTSIANSAALPRLAATCQFTLATDFARVGLTDSLAGPLFEAMNAQERTHDLAGFSATKQWAGFYLIQLGKMPEALTHLTAAWKAAQQSHSPNTAAWVALNRAGLAQVFYDAKSYNLWLDRADTLMHAIDDQQGMIELNRMLATRAHRNGDLAGADRYLRAAKTLADALREPSLQFSVSGGLWELAMQRGNLDEAASIAAQRQELIERYKLTGWQSENITDQVELALRRGDARSALPAIERVMATLHPSQKKYLFALEEQRALAQSMSGNARAAARTALSAAETFDSWRSSLDDQSLRSLSVQSHRGSGWYTSMLTSRLAGAGEVGVAFALSERRRARDLRDRMALASTYNRGGASPADPPQQAPMSVGELQRALPDNETAIVMMDAGMDGARGSAFVLTKRSLTAHTLPSTDEIAPRIRRLIALLESGRDASVEARALGSLLIAPLLSRLDSAGVSRLIVLPEGVLHRLPFDVLRLPDGRFLVERFQTAVAPSATVLLRIASTASRAGVAPTVLAFADARSRQPRGGDSMPDSPFFLSLFGSSPLRPRLTGARTEVSEVQRAFSRTTIRTGAAANETELKGSVSSYDVVHFATHAIVDEWSGASAALALTPTASDDGLLDSSEIARLRINASLVMLSACRTVGGEVVAGEGVRGLTSAFLQAGAKSVIATAWRVNDRDVVPLVAAVYQQLAKGKSVGSSLRSAQLDAIRRKVSPTVWGAFTLVGDPWRVVQAGAN
ncbi:MAG: CHAT domain-containing protein, partial [Gemmatimonas sp.]